MESRADLNKNAEDVAEMFDGVAAHYDMTNDVLSFGQDRLWRAAVADAVAPAPGVSVLDIACGTGTSTATFARRGADVTGCDISVGMISEGARRHPDLTFVQGDAMALPFDDDSFDVTTSSFGLRNVHDPAVALAQMYRVTKPGGKLVIAEFSHPMNAGFELAYKAYLTRIMPFVSKMVSSAPVAYDYLYESIFAWHNQESLARLIHEAGWRSVAYRNLSLGAVAVHRALKPAV